MATCFSHYNEEVKHHVHYVNGLPVPLFVTKERIDSLKDLELYPDDIWLTTYPKCGTTWMQQIVRSILRKEDESLNISDAIPWLAAKDLKCPCIVERPRAFKSHMPYYSMPCGLPSSTPCKYIYITRNPKDVAVSYFYFYFCRKYAEHLDWDTFIEWFLAGDVYFGNYFEHVLSWWEHRNDENVLFLKYEDMKKDIRSSIIRIAFFIGRKLSDQEIDLVVEKSSFLSMKENPTTNYEIPVEKLDPGGTQFMRKGIVGDWKEHFSAEQSSQFDAIYKAKFKPVGLEVDFE